MKKNIKSKPKTRNWLAVHAHFKTGAGFHDSAGKKKQKYSRKSKHKGKKYEVGS